MHRRYLDLGINAAKLKINNLRLLKQYKIDRHIVRPELARKARETVRKSTYFLYLPLVVLSGNVLNVPAVPLRNFGGGFLRLFVFRPFDLLGLVYSLGYPHHAHGAVSVSDHHLDAALSFDVFSEIAWINRQVKIIFAAYVIDRGALIVRHAYAILVRRGDSETTIGAVGLLIIAIEAAVTQKLIVATKLFAVRLLVHGVKIGIAFRR